MSAESEILHAVIESDPVAAEILLMDLSEIELSVFNAQLATLRYLIGQERKRRSARKNPSGDGFPSQGQGRTA